jgi:hypothetical protein
MEIQRVWLSGADTSEDLGPSRRQWLRSRRRERSAATIAVVVFGALAVGSAFAPTLERMLDVVFGGALGLLVVGWLTVQVIEEIKLRRCYDTPAQRAEALRKGAEAWRARQTAATLQAAPQATSTRQRQSHRVSGSTGLPATAGSDEERPPAGGNRAHRIAPRGYRSSSIGRPRRLPRC